MGGHPAWQMLRLHAVQVFLDPLDQFWKLDLFLVIQTGGSLKFLRKAPQ